MSSENAMRVIFEERGPALRDRLRERLDQAAGLRCAEHGEPIKAVIIRAHENGWFDTTWTTCCEGLERQATAIVKHRC